MNNSIKLLLFTLICLAPCAMQAMGALRNFGVRTFKAASASVAKLKTHAPDFNVPKTTRVSLGLTAMTGSGLWYYQQKYPHDFRSHLTAITPWHLQNLNTSTPENKRSEINTLLDQHSAELSIMFDKKEVSQAERERTAGGSYIGGHEGVVEFPWLPGYIIKRDASRLEGAQALKKYIQDNKLKFVTVPEKWIYQSAHMQQPLVIVKKIEFPKKDGDQINYRQAKDICSLLKNVRCFGWPYWDFSGGNLGCDTQGRLVFIDTERNSFDSRGPGEPLARLFDAAQDDTTAHYIEKQLASVSPDIHFDKTMKIRVGLFVLLSQKMGLSKNEAQQYIKTQLQDYIAPYDEASLKRYDDLVDMCLTYQKIDHVALNGPQKKMVESLEKKGYIHPRKAIEHIRCLLDEKLC